MVEIRERVQEVTIPVYTEAAPPARKTPTPKPFPAKPKPPVLAHVGKDALLSYGVPEEWLADAQQATEDTLFDVAAHLPALEQAFTYPWEKWTIFLHPAQSQLVERDYGGPARVSGSAGTGKSIVALHRAVHLVRSQPDSRVLLTTFSETLANALRSKLARLITPTPQLGDRIEVHALNAIGERFFSDWSAVPTSSAVRA